MTRHVCSHIQRQFYMAQQLDETSASYNIASNFICRGPIDVGRFTACVRGLMEHYEGFRSTYEMQDAVLYQKAGPDANLEVKNYTVPGRERVSFMRHAQVILDDESSRPFDLHHGPVMRLLVIRSEDPCLVALSIIVHHIAIDLRTKDLVGSYLSDSYNDKNDLCKVAGLDSYHEYVQSEREFLQSEKGVAMKKYWAAQLPDHTLSLPLAYDFPLPNVPSFAGDIIPFTFSPPMTTELLRYSADKKVDVFLTLLTAYYTLLYRYTGCNDFFVGVPLTNRREEKFKDTLGCFVNTLPVAILCDGKQGFAAALQAMRGAMLIAHRNQSLPYEVIVNSMSTRPTLSRNPIFQVGFTFEHPMVLDLHGIEIETVSSNTRGAQLELFLRCWRSKNGIECRLEFNSGLFQGSTVQSFVRSFQTLLSSVLNGGDGCGVDELEIISSEDRAQLNTFNATDRPYKLETLQDAFENQVARTPQNPALYFQGQSLTYSEFNGRVNRLAHYLHSKGVKPGDHIPICMYRSFEMFIGIYAIIKIGASYVPINPEIPDKRVAYIIEDIGNLLVLVTWTTLPKVAKIKALSPVAVDSDWPLIRGYSADNPPSAADLSDDAYVIYTSGSTGKPKGTINGHAGVSSQLCWIQETFPLRADDRVLAKTAYDFDVSVWEIFWPFQVGAAVEIAPPSAHRDPSLITQLIRDSKITTVHFVPSMLDLFLAYKSGEALPSLRRVLCIGEALSVKLTERFHNRFLHTELHNLYGPTEAAVSVTHWQSRPGPKHFVPIGRAIANTQLYVLNGCNRLQPIGASGELCIGGIQVAKGYWHNEPLTAEKFIADPFARAPGKLYRTGDLCRILPDGNIQYLGRMDFQAKIRGNRVEFGEIEAVLVTYPGIGEAVVVIKQLGGDSQELMAYFTGQNADVSALRTHCRKELPEYMVPAYFMHMTELPLTKSGKVDRKALPDLDVSQATQKRELVMPRTDMEKELHTLWTKALKTARVGVTDNFFDVGGNSILLLGIFSELAEKRKDLRMLSLFQYPSIEQLAAYMENERPPDNCDAQDTLARAEKHKRELKKRREMTVQNKVGPKS